MKILRRNIWAATALVMAILALSSWAVSSPVGSSPDDDFHSASIWCGQGFRDGLCEEGSEPGFVLVPGTVVTNWTCYASQPTNSGSCPEVDSLVQSNRANTSGQYPALYYWIASWFTSQDVAGSMISVRVFNSILAVGLISLIVLVVQRQFRRVPIMSLVVTSVPLGMFLIPSVNPSSWAIVSVVVFFTACLGLFAKDQARRKIPLLLISVISIVMGLGSRDDSPVFFLIAGGLAWIVSYSRNAKFSLKLYLTIGIGIALAASLFIVLTLPSENFIGYFLRGTFWWGGETTPESTFRNFVSLPDLFVGAFGTWGLGWLDTPMPSGVWAVTYAVYCAIVFASARYFDLKQTIATSLSFIALVFIPMYAFAVNQLSVGQIIQPRYLLPLLLIIVAVSLYRPSVDDGLLLSGGQVLAVGLALTSANALALHTNLRRYLTGLDGNQLSLNRGIEWWWVDPPLVANTIWFSPNNLFLGGSLAFAVFLFALWNLRVELGLPGYSDAEKPQRASSNLAPIATTETLGLDENTNNASPDDPLVNRRNG